MKLTHLVAAVLALLALSTPCGAVAAQSAGALDRTFGNKRLLVARGFGEQRIALDREGRILAAAGTSGGFQVARYLPDGRFDSSFGANGTVELALPGSEGQVAAIRVQPDGKVLVGGSFVAARGEGYYDRVPVLARINADGSTDQGFGEFNGFHGRPGLIETQRNFAAVLVHRGKIVIAGEEGRGYVARFNGDGSQDRSFSRDGWASVPPLQTGRVYPTNGFTGVSGLLPGRGGSLYATGWTQDKLMVARLRADGRLDRSFGKRGIVRTKVDGYPPCHCLRASGVSRDRRGRLVVVGTINALAGWSVKLAPRKVVLARYWPDGRLDRSFGGDGVVYAAAASSTFGNGIAIQRDGRILVAGSGAKGRRGTSDGPARFLVFRFLADGRRDRSFFGDGVFAARFRAFGSWAAQALIQRDGRVLVAGTGIFQAPYSDLRGLLTRFRFSR
jgi:uncharacterized delta-60 repeat protein